MTNVLIGIGLLVLGCTTGTLLALCIVAMSELGEGE